MPDWKRFRQAFRDGSRLCHLLQTIHEVETWVDLPLLEALAALQGSRVATDEEARGLSQAISVVRVKLQREAGTPAGPEARAWFEELFRAMEEDRATAAERRFADRMTVSLQLYNSLVHAHPALANPIAPAELARANLRQAMSEIFPRVARISPYVIPGGASPDRLAELEQILGSYRGLEAPAGADNPALPELYWAMGNMELLIAKMLVLLNRHQEGLGRFEEAGRLFDRAGDPRHAANCRARAEDLNLKLAGDTDQSTERTLAGLASPEPATDPLARAAGLVALMETTGAAGDTFGAGETAEAAAGTLHDMGYLDPMRCGFEAAVDSWIATAAASAVGIPFLALVHQIVTFYGNILGARVSAKVKSDPKVSDEANRILRAIPDLVAQMGAQSDVVDAALQHDWAVYFPAAGSPAPSAEIQPNQQMTQIDDALLEIRQECNRRMESGNAIDDLLEPLDGLREAVAPLHMPLYDAKVRLERAYVLGHLGRATEMLKAAQDAQSALLAGRPAALSSFSQSFERAVYLEALARQAQGQMMTGDVAGAFRTCEEVIRDIETSRYRVNSPFQQTGFLSNAVPFYQWGAFAAFKLQRWDDMLECMELVKARSAVRSRLASGAPEVSVPELEKQFRETSEALDRAWSAGAAAEDLATRRRWLWDMLSISRGRGAAQRAIPELRLANLQAAVATDEAAIGYFWLTATTVLVVLFDRDRFHAERINLNPRKRQLLTNWINAIRTLASPSRALDAVAARLGAALFPAFCRDFVAAKRRLIISPNQGLHLFPFHAARLEEDFLGVRYSVRYVPNFSSLLLPWHGSGGKRVLAIGVRECGIQGYDELPNVEEEVRQVAETYRARGIPVDVLIGPDACRQRLEQLRAEGKSSQYRSIHLATHGVSVFERPDQPLESKLLLWRSELDSMDIAGLRIEAELAVLSACNSGQRAISGRGLDELPGDEIFGLQSALFQSGVRSVLGALWPVETVSAMAIVTAFHRHYAAGNAPEVALQSAVAGHLSQTTRYREIYYWAPFFLTSLGSAAPANPNSKEN